MTTTPRLTDPRGMGGMTAQGGFDRQEWSALWRLPTWLRYPNFEEIIFEGFEDFEARFFSPYAPETRVLDRFQSKSGDIDKAQIVSVIQSFLSFDASHPRVARTQSLIAASYPPALKWISNDPKRIQKARPFYAPFRDILKPDEDIVRQKFVSEFGAPLGEFAAGGVQFETEAFSGSGEALARFSAAIASAFPTLDVTHSRYARAFDALLTTAKKYRGQPIGRGTILALLKEAFETPVPVSAHLPVHIRSDGNAAEEFAIEIDASAFSGGAIPYPPTDKWDSHVLAPLSRIAKWARGRSDSRIVLSGSFRLSTAWAIGWSFRSGIGFEIEVPVRGGAPWATDDRPVTAIPWTITPARALVGGRLLVAIGCLRDPAADMANSFGADRATQIHSAFFDSALTNAREVQSSALQIKHAVSANAAALGAKSIDLVYAGPAQLAVALGHRWNAMPSTRCHEFGADRRYLPTVEMPNSAATGETV